MKSVKSNVFGKHGLLNLFFIFLESALHSECWVSQWKYSGHRYLFRRNWLHQRRAIKVGWRIFFGQWCR